MKVPRRLAMSASAAMLACAAGGAAAQARAVMGGGPRSPIPNHAASPTHGFGHHRVFFPLFVTERETVIVEREVVREVPAGAGPPPSPPPSPAPREPYAIGKSYDSLPPQGCMKLIEAGGSYYLCSGEWYRQVGSGKAATYKAVARP